jgi:glutamyl-tRNA reductase
VSGVPAGKVRPLRPEGGSDRDVDLVVVGVSHHTAPVEVRERLAFPEVELGAIARRLLDGEGALGEALILSTCNRIEIFAVVRCGSDAIEPVTRFLSRERAVSAVSLAHHCYVHRGKAAIRHLFRVASSLDSMMVGEPQILGQLKEQFRIATAAGAAGGVLRRCVERSFRVAKRVRTETGIAGKAVSVSSAAVDLAQRIFDDLRDKTAMLIGAGKMSVLAARHLQSHGIASVIVTNRSFDRAVELARGFGGTPVPFERFPQYLHLADVVIGSVAATGYILGASHLHDVLRARRRRPMFFIDLGVPRNFDPGINDLENVYLYNIDDLSKVAGEHRAEREREAERAEAIVDEETERFWRARSAQDLTPTIVALRGKLDGIRRAELERALAVLSRIEPEERRALEAMTSAIVNKILHAPLAVLKEMARHEDGDAAAEVAELVHRLFALEPRAAAEVAGGESDPQQPSSGGGREDGGDGHA